MMNLANNHKILYDKNMNAKTKEKKNLILMLLAGVSILVLIVCIVQFCFYTISSYRQSAQHAALRGLIGSSKVTLSQDLETGRPAVISDAAEAYTDEQTAASGEDTPSVLDKYISLYELNSDLVGWISIEGTEIDYPVMQTLYDEEYYLHRDFYREDAKPGLPFMDSRCIISAPSTNLIIYGHNMKNGSMFADLLKYEDEAFYKEHRFIRFDTIYEEALYEIVAVFRTRVAYSTEDTFRFYNFIQADSAQDFYEYYTAIRSLSLYDIDATAYSSDYLLTLATCEYTVEDGRFVVVARRITSVD